MKLVKPSSDVSAIRNEIGKTALGMLSTLLLGLISWGAVQVWAAKLDVATFSDHLAKDAMHDQLDSIHLSRLDRQLACATKSPRCKRHI